jgi:hypothetical protein
MLSGSAHLSFIAGHSWDICGQKTSINQKCHEYLACHNPLISLFCFILVYAKTRTA